VPVKKRLRTVISLKLCRSALVKCLAVLVIISACLNSPVRAQESEDSQIFISGFNAYQQKDYATTISRMNEVLQKHPDSPLRDMVLFWLSRAYFKSGNQQDAARYMSQFIKEYPDNPLKGTVDEELLALTARYDRGESLKGGAAEQERRAAAAKAEAARAAAEKAEQARLAAVRAEEQRQAAARAEADRLAAEQAEQARVALKRKADVERGAAAKAEADQKAAEAARLAAAKVEQERAAAPQKVEAEKVDMAVVARQQEEMVRQALAKTEQKRLAAAKAAEEREAADRAAKAEMVRQMTVKAEAEQKAAAAEEKRLAAIKAEEDRVANEKGERLRGEREKIESERKAALAAEQARLASAKAEADRKVAEAARIAEQERENVETAKRAAVEAEQQKQAALKAERERLAVQRAEKERQAAAVVAATEPAPAPAPKKQPQKAAGKKAQLREKAIAQYQAVIEKYPNSKAAATAAAKLRELGVTPPRSKQAAVAAAPSTVPTSENSQVLRLEVAQFAGLEFNLTAPARPINASQRVSVPFEIRNQGNGSDSFYLESGFPAEYGALFSAASAPDQQVSQTPTLAPGETFKGVITVTVPAGCIDGQRILYPVKATSRTFTEAAQTREIRLVAAAPLLRAMVRADRAQLLPGDRVAYRVSILNVGSTAAQDVSFRLSFPPQLEPLDAAAAGFRQELKAALAVDGLQIKSGESREFTLTFQLKDDTLAGQELLTRGELVNNQLKTAAAFVSNGTVVQQKRGVAARAAADRQVVVPGQTVTIPFVVTNTGNVREKFRVVPSAAGVAGAVILFHDLNRDGVRQAGEPVITEIGPLAPREEAGIGMEIATVRAAVDGSEETARIAFVSEGDEARSATVATRLIYSRPVLQLAMAGRDGRLKPGEVSSFDLTVSNRGSNLAQTVELQSVLPEQLELVAADPLTSGGAGPLTWRFKELGAGEKRTVKVSFRVRPGTGMGTSLQVKNTLSYEDQIGNRY